MACKASGVLLATIMAGLCASFASGAETDPHVDLRQGQAAAIPVSVVDGRVLLGPARLGKLGSLEAKPGEIVVGLAAGDRKTLLAPIAATERTSVPIDFVASGMIGEIKIDERVLCGRLDGPVTGHIGSVAWKVTLHEFTVGKGGACD